MVIVEPGLAALVRAEARGRLLVVVPDAPVDDVVRMAEAVLHPEELRALRRRLSAGEPSSACPPAC